MKMEEYKGMQACILENEKLEVRIHPGLGGKVASLVFKPAGFEAAAQTNWEHRRPMEEEPRFSDFDSSGLDEVFPTINECSLDGQDAGFYYPDHGEVWSTAMDCEEEEGALKMSFESPKNPYRYEKKLQLKDSSLRWQFRITNTGDRAFPCLFALHGLMRYEPDMRLLYPSSVKEFLNVYTSPELGEDGTVFQVEDGTTGHAGSLRYDFRQVPPPEPMTRIKYYVNGPIQKGVCGYEYPSQGVRCILRFPADKLPYLGFWLTAGRYRGEYNCAWEPSSGFYDSTEIASKNGTLTRLQPGETVIYDLSLSFSII